MSTKGLSAYKNSEKTDRTVYESIRSKTNAEVADQPNLHECEAIYLDSRCLYMFHKSAHE